MPDMRILVSAFSGSSIQAEGTLPTGERASAVVEVPIGGVAAQQYSTIIDAVKAVMSETYGTVFVPSDKIELWCGRAI